MSIATLVQTIDRIKSADPGREIAVFDVGSDFTFDSFFAELAPEESENRKLIGKYNSTHDIKKLRRKLDQILENNELSFSLGFLMPAETQQVFKG